MNLRIVDAGSREEFADLAKRMHALIDRSGGDFDVVMWSFTIKTNGFRSKFDRSKDDYDTFRKLVKWFRMNVASQKTFSLAQRESAATMLENDMTFISGQFSQPNTNDTVEIRREILQELEDTVSVFESVLPKSLNTYSLRGKLLRFQEDCVASATNTRTPVELKLAGERHRMVAAALGIGTSVAELIAPAFESYLNAESDDATKQLALNKVGSAMRDFMSLDLAGITTVFNVSKFSSFSDSLFKLSSRDAMWGIYERMLQRYIELYEEANRDLKTIHLRDFCTSTKNYTNLWWSNKETKRFIELWDKAYKDIPIESNTEGDKSSLIELYQKFVIVLMQTGRKDDAMLALRLALTLSEKILSERPWDWYLEDAYGGLCFETARTLKEADPDIDVQELLGKAWKTVFRRFACEELAQRYSVLPLKGELPVDVDEKDREFFAAFAPDSKVKGGMTRFTVPCNFDGVKYPFHIYILKGKNGYNELLSQFKWLEVYRGGAVPDEVKDSFKRLNAIAVENKVDFRELCVYALGTADDELKKAQAENQLKFDILLEKIQGMISLPAALNDKQMQKEIAEVADQVSYLALKLQRWYEAELYGKMTVQCDPAIARGYSTYSLASLYRGKKDIALQVLQEQFDRPELVQIVLEELDQLEREKIKCDDAPWFRAAVQPLDYTDAILSLSAVFFDHYHKSKTRSERNAEKIKLHDLVLRAIASNHLEAADKITELLADLTDANPREFAWRIVLLFLQNRTDEMEWVIQLKADEAILGDSIFSFIENFVQALEKKGLARTKTLSLLRRAKQGQLEKILREKESMQAEMKSENFTPLRKKRFATIYNRAADSGLYVGRLNDAESLARLSIEHGETNTAAYGTLAESLILQGKYSQALEICKQHWSDPLNGMSFAEVLASDFSALSEFGISHPDTEKLFKEMSQPARP